MLGLIVGVESDSVAVAGRCVLLLSGRSHFGRVVVERDEGWLEAESRGFWVREHWPLKTHQGCTDVGKGAGLAFHGWLQHLVASVKDAVKRSFSRDDLEPER